VASDGDAHDPAGPEHGCAGAVHLCSCCVSLGCLPSCSSTIARLQRSGELLSLDSTRVPAASGSGFYHPPRV
jgi:hypothetical protein